MREAFHKELALLCDSLVEMARPVGSAIGRATTALLDADLQLAESVITGDAKVDDALHTLGNAAYDADMIGAWETLRRPYTFENHGGHYQFRLPYS